MAHFFRPIPRILPVHHRLLFVLLLSTVGSLSGFVPGLSRDLSQLEITSVAQAQSLLPKVSNYADAVLQMEKIRINALNKVRSYMGKETPKNVCRQDDLPNSVQSTCTEFYNQSADIIQRNGLSNWEFNQITEKVRSNALYRQRLDQELRRRQ
ncbi:MAG: DUF4168 domain-containing protein [Thermosynechococcaceae cyanobacterium]